MLMTLIFPDRDDACSLLLWIERHPPWADTCKSWIWIHPWLHAVALGMYYLWSAAGGGGHMAAATCHWTHPRQPLRQPKPIHRTQGRMQFASIRLYTCKNKVCMYPAAAVCGHVVNSSSTNRRACQGPRPICPTRHEFSSTWSGYGACYYSLFPINMI